MVNILSQTIVMRVGDDLVSELTRALNNKGKNTKGKDILILNAKFIKKTEFDIAMEVEYQL